MYAVEFEDEKWRDEARRADGSASLTPLFFSEQLDDMARAKAFCRGCVVREECLDAATYRRGNTLPQLPPMAMRGARHAARSILGDLSGKTRTRFRYIDKGVMATIDHRSPTEIPGGTHFGGTLGWLSWLSSTLSTSSGSAAGRGARQLDVDIPALDRGNCVIVHESK